MLRGRGCCALTCSVEALFAYRNSVGHGVGSDPSQSANALWRVTCGEASWFMLLLYRNQT